MVFDLLAFPAFKTKYELLRLKLLACLYLFSSILLTNYLTFFAKHSSICDFYDPVPSIHHFFGFHCTRRIRRRVYFNVLASTRPTSIEVLQIISGKKMFTTFTVLQQNPTALSFIFKWNVWVLYLPQKE